MEGTTLGLDNVIILDLKPEIADVWHTDIIARYLTLVVAGVRYRDCSMYGSPSFEGDVHRIRRQIDDRLLRGVPLTHQRSGRLCLAMIFFAACVFPQTALLEEA